MNPALERLLLSLADSKRLLGIRYSDWLLGAPSIEAGIAASSMAQDEWGHARLLYSMLKELDIDPLPVEHDRPPEQYANVDALDEPFEDWAGFVVATVIVDTALTTALEGFGAGAFELAGNRVPKMVAEEEFHSALGIAWFRRLAEGTEEARAALRRECDRTLPRTLAWIDPADESRAALEAAGLIEAAVTLRSRYLDRLRDTLARVGVEVETVVPDRSGWDATRGRGPGAPALEAVERARGDRNRELFVE